MAKTAVSTMITRLKRRLDYDITDDDLSNLLVDCISDGLKLIYQWISDAGLYIDIGQTNVFKTTADQNYIDLETARIVSTAASFTGTADDKLKLTIDGTAYDDINIGTATTIALVVSAINTAVGSTVASEDDDGYLVITSPTTGVGSSVIVADGTTTAQTVVADLFSSADDRSCSAITSMDDIVSVSERINDNDLDIIPYDKFVSLYTDPTLYTTNTPEQAAIYNNRLYLGGTPSVSTTAIYVESLSIPSDVTSSSTLPYKTKYDPLVLATARCEFLRFYDGNNASAIRSAEQIMEYYKNQLITNASNNRSMNLQVSSRRGDEPTIGGRIPTSPGDISV